MNCLKIISYIFLSLIFIAGCANYYGNVAPETNFYYLNRNKDFSSIGRVALVELDNFSDYPQISLELTRFLYQAMQKKQLFGITMFQKDDPAWKSLKLDIDPAPGAQTGVLKNSSAYSYEQLSAIHKTLKHDAVLIGVISDFKYYPHMSIGLRLKMIDLKDGQLLWALEQIWDTADKSTEKKVKNYFRQQVRSGFDPLREKLTTVSAINFTKFVSFEVAETLNAK